MSHRNPGLCDGPAFVCADGLSARLHLWSMSGPHLLPQLLALARDGQPFSSTACSDLSMERYHALSDATMTTILERLEELLDEVGNDAYEVDYHVSSKISDSRASSLRWFM